MYSDELTEAILEDKVPRADPRGGPQGHACAADDAGLHGLGLQEQGRAELLDGVNAYLPNPTEVKNEAIRPRQREADCAPSSSPRGSDSSASRSSWKKADTDS
jgi:hypothetical protein